jgi:ankyrin repeat protein
LLQAGADPNSRNRAGFTPLMLASSPGVANCLLDNGADIAHVTDKGSTALELACGRGDLAVVKVLLKRGALGQILNVSQSCHTPLSAAANNQREDVTLLLLQHLVLQSGFDINHPRLAANQPLLCCAAVAGLRKVAEFALAHGADPNATGPNGPPLILAVQYGHPDIANLLCEKGAELQTRFGSSNALDLAVIIANSTDMVKLLIKHGADVNVVADSAHPPAVLQAAVLGGCDSVQLLLDAGAVLDAELQCEAINSCCSMLDDAAAVKVVKLLLPHCSSFADNHCKLGHMMLAHAVAKGKLQIARVLHAAGADVHRTDDNGTLMHYATESGNLAVVKWLQSLGLDARAVAGKRQLLPLHCACEYKHLHLVKYLLALTGAADDVHAQCVSGQAPLHAAAIGAADSVVQLLLQQGANADARAMKAIHH